MIRITKNICLVSPFPPPYGGMAIQAQKMGSLLRQSGFNVLEVKTNPEPAKRFHFIEKIKGFRTLPRLFLFLYHLHKTLPHVEVVYFLTGFFNFFFWVTFPALILIKLHGKRVVLSARGGEARRFFEKYGLLIKPILKMVDSISVPSEFLRDAFWEGLNLKTTIVPNIADIGQFKFYERYPVRPRLLNTRNLDKIYNVGCTIKAFKIVHEQFPESSLGLVGDGSERQELEHLVKELGLNHSVTFYGAVEHSKISNLYDQYDIYVNASNVDNMPGTILEAFASGLPVVSTNVGGIPYIIEDETTGLLVEKEDYESMALKVIELLRNPEKALTLAQNARVECQKYLWENVKTILIPLLERYISDAKN